MRESKNHHVDLLWQIVEIGTSIFFSLSIMLFVLYERGDEDSGIFQYLLFEYWKYSMRIALRLCLLGRRWSAHQSAVVFEPGAYTLTSLALL